MSSYVIICREDRSVLTGGISDKRDDLTQKHDKHINMSGETAYTIIVFNVGSFLPHIYFFRKSCFFMHLINLMSLNSLRGSENTTFNQFKVTFDVTR